MPARGSIQLARIFGIRVGVSASWFLILFLIIYYLSSYFHDVLGGSRSTSYAVAVAAALGYFASLVLHELGHALTARRLGYQIDGIELWFFGGLARMSGEPETPGEELRIAAAGPLVTLLIVGACVGAGVLAASGHRVVDVALRREGFITTPALALIGWLGFINAVLFVFNIVPAFPLDGGRIARAILWWRTGDRNRGTRYAGRAGQAFAVIIAGYGLYSLAHGGFGLLWLLMAFFLWQAAGAAVLQGSFGQRMADLRVADIMDRQPVTVPADITLLDVQEQYFGRFRWPWFAVTDAGRRFLGVIRETRVEAEIAAGRPALHVGEVLDEDAATARIAPEQTLEALLRSEALRRMGAVVAVDAEGVLQGVVTLAQVRRALSPAGRASAP